MQSTADVTAASAATWTARGMNTVAMINVLNTKLLSMTVITNSAQKTVEVLIPIAKGQSAAFFACSGVPIVGGFCMLAKAVVDFQKAALETLLKPPLTQLKNSVTACPKAAWKVMEGMSKAAEVMAVSFPKIGYAEGIAIATLKRRVQCLCSEGPALRLGSRISLTLRDSLSAQTMPHLMTFAAPCCPVARASSYRVTPKALARRNMEKRKFGTKRGTPFLIYLHIRSSTGSIAQN